MIVLTLVSVVSYLFIQSVFIYSIIYNYALITPNIERFSVYVIIDSVRFEYTSSYSIVRYILTTMNSTTRCMILSNWIILQLPLANIMMFMYDRIWVIFNSLSYLLDHDEVAWISFKFSSWYVHDLYESLLLQFWFFSSLSHVCYGFLPRVYLIILEGKFQLRIVF